MANKQTKKRPGRKPGDGGRKPGTSPKSAGEWKAVFLHSLGIMPVVRVAAQKAGISRQVAYRTREQDPDFAAAWDSAKEDGVDLIEAALHKRAREKSDVAAIFMLKSHRRQIYGEKVEHLGSGSSGEIEIRLNIPTPSPLEATDGS